MMCFPNSSGIYGALDSTLWCEPHDGVRKELKAWKYTKISELPRQKIAWKNTDLKINFVILRIINSICSLKNDEISFVLLIKLWTVCAMSMKSIR